MYFSGRFFDAFYITPLVVRSVAPKFVEAEEVGRLYAILSIIENLAQTVFVPMYNTIFNTTLTSFPGAYLCVSMAMLATTAIIFM